MLSMQNRFQNLLLQISLHKICWRNDSNWQYHWSHYCFTYLNYSNCIWKYFLSRRTLWSSNTSSSLWDVLLRITFTVKYQLLGSMSKTIKCMIEIFKLSSFGSCTAVLAQISQHYFYSIVLKSKVTLQPLLTFSANKTLTQILSTQRSRSFYYSIFSIVLYASDNTANKEIKFSNFS